MNFIRIALISLLSLSMLAACDDDISGIGNSISKGELTIHQDTLNLEVEARTVASPVIDGRSTKHLLGRLSSEQYGDLSGSFVAQMMAATSLAIPDSIDVNRIDSVKLIFSMPRGQFSGDSLAPQQMSVYRLTQQLPSGIQSNFNPDGYFDPSSPLARKVYTLSNISVSDTVTSKTENIRVGIKLPTDFGREIFNAYKNTPEVFQWPASFNKFFPGIYVTRTFGSGCIANVRKAEMMLYYHYLFDKVENVDGTAVTKQIHLRDSVAVFATAPEVLSSNNISFTPSAALIDRINNGQHLIVSPAGYNVRFTFPAQSIIDKYNKDASELAVISNLTFSIPTQIIPNDLGINPAPYLLMVKTSEAEEFFNKNKVPDNLSSFYASYSSSDGKYNFLNLRSYIINLIEKGEVTAEDIDFTLIPVNIETEAYTSGGSTATTVTRCSPYIAKPTMVRLNMDRASIIFTFSSQQLF
ncbi:MAG: DUF4270 family protein [Muribaculaceae bacterium]|nr:DUF4270 family protein [Muribaculaceae bacterium]